MGVYLRLIVLLATLVGVCLLAAPSPAAAATTYVVNSTNDPGDGVCNVAECTLREAITAANGDAALDTIAFNIPGPNPHTITVASSLPPITQPLYVDGSTQPGFAGSPVVEVTGADTVDFGYDVQVADTVIRGLAVTNFSQAGIRVSQFQAQNVRILGNYVGVNPDGVTAGPNHEGVLAENAGSIFIGGSAAGDGNVISGNYNSGIRLEQTLPAQTSATVLGNRVGTDPSGTIPVPNGNFGILSYLAGPVSVGGPLPGEGNTVAFNGGTGIFIGADSAVVQGNRVTENTGPGIWALGGPITIGGGMPGAGNWISGNGLFGILLYQTGNVVQGNKIGTDVSGLLPFPNFLHGIASSGSSDNLIGGLGPGEGNVIAGNLGDGIGMSGSTGLPNSRIEGNKIGVGIDGVTPIPNGNNGVRLSGALASVVMNTIAFNVESGVDVTGGGSARIQQNSIHDNNSIGIDLRPDQNHIVGVTQNDPLDADDGSSHLQNFPEILSASVASSTHLIDAELHSSPSSNYVIDLYSNPQCDPSTYGEGQRWIGSTTASTNAAGDALFSFSGGTYTVGDNYVTATATDSDGNTSEFSACVAVANPAVGGTVTLATSRATNHTAAPYPLALIPALAAGLWLSRRLLRS